MHGLLRECLVKSSKQKTPCAAFHRVGVRREAYGGAQPMSRRNARGSGQVVRGERMELEEVPRASVRRDCALVDLDRMQVAVKFEREVDFPADVVPCSYSFCRFPQGRTSRRAVPSVNRDENRGDTPHVSCSPQIRAPRGMSPDSRFMNQ